jgi:hypothetical protein
MITTTTTTTAAPGNGGTITSISTDFVNCAAVYTGVTITGSGTSFGGNSVVTFGDPHVTASAVSVTDATHLTFTMTVTQYLAIGTNNISVTVTTGSQVASGNGLISGGAC